PRVSSARSFAPCASTCLSSLTRPLLVFDSAAPSPPSPLSLHDALPILAPAFALGHFLLNVHKPLHSVLFRGGYLGSGNLQAVFYGAWGIGGSGWRFGCSGGVLL